jgi:hypothetical protein
VESLTKERMMKKFYLLLGIFLIFGLIFSVDDIKFPINESGEIFYTEVVEIPNVTKDVLYSRGYEWFAKTFKSAQDVIQMQDKERGKLIGRGMLGDINVKVSMGTYLLRGYIKFTISLYFKDGKYKFEITDFNHESVPTPKGFYNGGSLENEKAACGKTVITNKKWKNIKNQAKEKIELLIDDLKKFMVTEPSGDDW